MGPAVDEAVALTATVVPETIEPLKGAVIVAVTGEGPPPPVVLKAIEKTSNVPLPCVHARPIWPVPVSVRLPVMNLRVCVPLFVPGTTAHGVQAVPVNFVKRIEFGPSVLIRNSQTLVPSVAPNRPPAALNA